MSFNCCELLTLEKSVRGGRKEFGGCMQDMRPGTVVGEDHPGNVQRAASVAITQDARAVWPSVDAVQDPCHRLWPRVRDDDSRQLRGKKALDGRVFEHKAAFNVVAGNAKAFRLDNDGNAAAQTVAADWAERVVSLMCAPAGAPGRRSRQPWLTRCAPRSTARTVLSQ